MRLSSSRFQGDDVVGLAKGLLGKELHCTTEGLHTAGLIVETEAYRGAEDRASHAYNNRRTRRTETLFQAGGRSYVYLCYGMHYLLNIVTGPVGTPHAALVRALVPTRGVEVMQKRRGERVSLSRLCAGPGMVTQAMGIVLAHDNTTLEGDLLWIEERGVAVAEEEITSGPRIGVDYAGEDALLPWRFRIKEEQYDWLLQQLGKQ